MSSDPAFDAAMTALNAEHRRLNMLIEGLNNHADAFVDKHGDSYFCTDVTRQLIDTSLALSRVNRKFEKPLQHILPWR